MSRPCSRSQNQKEISGTGSSGCGAVGSATSRAPCRGSRCPSECGRRTRRSCRNGAPSARAVFRAVRRALTTISRRVSFRVVHMWIQHNHVHVLVEAEDKLALSRGMQAFAIAAAKAYQPLARAPRQGVRVPVSRHRGHQATPDAPRVAVHAEQLAPSPGGPARRRRRDAHRYSSAITFEGWKGRRLVVPDDYTPLPVARPQTRLPASAGGSTATTSTRARHPARSARSRGFTAGAVRAMLVRGWRVARCFTSSRDGQGRTR